MRRFILPALAIIATSSLATPAFAAPVTIRVSHADLDLSSKTDLKIMKRRINAAAEEACVIDSTSIFASTRVDWDCVNRIAIEAFAQLVDKRKNLNQ